MMLGMAKGGVFHSAGWHDGDWSNDGIREEWLWRFPLSVRTVETVLNPISWKSMMLGMAKAVFSILLSGMMAVDRTMESGRSGYGASSGWKVV
ncbi:hypothetical protein TNCV_1028171 [Trichonephila clavipes]|nr:hypothetical protein TNCV_1028171 [Trichonephila clavipes]